MLITIDYTALDSFQHRGEWLQRLDRSISAERPFSFRHQFADQWYDLHNPGQTATPMSVRFKTRAQDFPPNVEYLKIEQVALYFAGAGGEEGEIELTFAPEGHANIVGGKATPIDGVVSTRRGNAPSWAQEAMIGKRPVGEWKLTLPQNMRSRLEDEEIEDILLVITYSGETPDWPA